jgi:hypothetical protein
LATSRRAEPSFTERRVDFVQCRKAKASHLGEVVDLVLCQKHEARALSERRLIFGELRKRGRAFRRGGQISPGSRKSRHASRRGGRFGCESEGEPSRIGGQFSPCSRKSRHASRRGSRVRHVSEISAGSPARWSISPYLPQNATPGFSARGGSSFRPFSAKSVVGRGVSLQFASPASPPPPRGRGKNIRPRGRACLADFVAPKP